jgi:hypothetical protein
MFEQSEWGPFADAVPLDDAPNPNLPPVDWTDEQVATWIDELAAADPQRPRTAAEVLATAATPVTPQLVEDLHRIDPATLSDDDRLAVSAAWKRVGNYADAQAGAAVAAIVADEIPNRVIEPRHITNSLVAEALAVGMGEADSLTETSHLLATRLHATATQVRAGAVSWDKASYLAWKTSLLTDTQARAVEARVLPAAARRTPAQHAAAVRRAVDRIDPQGAANRRKQLHADIRLVRRHLGDGMGELFAHLPVEQQELIWTAAELHARRAKAAGDPRTLDHLRVQAIVDWATASLTGHPIPTTPVEPVTDERPVPTSVPTRHGRRASVRIVWDLTSLLGVTDHPAELADSAESIPPAAMRGDVLAEIGRVRRLLIEPSHGELVDLTPRSWTLPGRTDGQRSAYLLDLIVETWQRTALLTGDITDLTPAQVATVQALQTALDSCDPALRDVLLALLAFDVTAESLDDDPDAETPSAALAEFVCVRDRHPVNPCAGPTPATAGDLDHVIPRSQGGTTTRTNLAPLTRRWHRLKTFGGWQLRRHGRGWEWTSPTGRKHHTYPHDYRLGP